MIETRKMRLIGDSPLMMHNGRLSDPLNARSKELKKIANKRKKTDEDIAEIGRLEWYGGIYTDEEDRVCIPADVVLATMIRGAMKHKCGPQAKAGVFESAPTYPLTYDGPRKLERLFADPRFVDRRRAGVQRSAVMRTRPIFHEWSLDVELNIDTDIVDPDDVVHWMRTAGQLIGLCDYRPRYGRFSVNVL